mmetsp:Transcript_2620/g.4100  ORF Transcript_2620/g.4100 Transcript_2620/m.4100 type:complete len:541 (+) Transcript_2620:68-1690(+)
MKRRSAEDHSDGAADDEEKHRRIQNLQSRRGSRLRHHFSSIMLPKHVSMSLALLRSILVIYIAAKFNDITSSPMVDAASSNGIHCTTRAAFCSHNTRQATSLRSGELGNIRPHSTLPIELGQNFRANCKRNGNGCLPVVSFPSSSTSALGLTDKQSTPDETIDVNGDTTIDNDESQTNGISDLVEGSASPLIETDLAPISTDNLDIQSKTSDTATREQGRAFLARISVLFSVVVLAVLKMSPSGAWRYYLAGGICASTSHAITTPIDVVKTRQQVDPTLQGKTMWKATLAIVKQGGPFALLAGLGPTALGYLLEGGAKFGIYEVSKPFTQRLLATVAAFLSLPGLNSKVISLTLCGLIAGTAASLMLSPMEALRIRMVSDSEYAGKGSIDAMLLMIRREGLSSISKGMPAMLLKQVPYTITKNCSFDMLTMSAYRILREMGYALTANVKIAVPLLSAVAAAILSCISSHPGDMLLSLVNAHEGPKRTRDFAKEILHGKDGARGFLVGIKPRFLHVILIVTVQLMIYDFAKRLVGIAATGL